MRNLLPQAGTLWYLIGTRWESRRDTAFCANKSPFWNLGNFNGMSDVLAERAEVFSDWTELTYIFTPEANGQYCFGFSYNIPNNSLPIFWSSSNGWKPIFYRKEKYQNAKQAKREYDFFI